MADFRTAIKLIITKDDLLKVPRATLKDSEGEAVNISGCTIAFRMVNVDTGVVQVDNAAGQNLQNDADSTTTGKVRYVWSSGDTAVAGLYRCYFVVTNTDKSTHYPPDDDFYILIIDPDATT